MFLKKKMKEKVLKKIIITKIINLHPRYLNSDILTKINTSQFKGICTENEGVIVLTEPAHHISNKIISNGITQFTINFYAFVFKPFVGQEMEMESNYMILYDYIILFCPQLQKENKEKEHKVKVVIDQILFDGQNFNCLCKLN